MRAQQISLAVLVLSLAGCKSYVRPFDDTPLPAREIVTTSGRKLEAKDGKLLQTTGRGEIGRLLGVELDEDERGVVVGRALRSATTLSPDRTTVLDHAGLRPDDRILVACGHRARSSRDPEALAKADPAVVQAKLAEIDRSRAADVAARGGLQAGDAPLTADETAAVLSLWSIEVAQNVYRERADSKQEYGTLGALSSAGLVDPQLGTGVAHGYRFVCEPSPEDKGARWYATAFPETPRAAPDGSLHFYTTQHGMVGFSRGPFSPDTGAHRYGTGVTDLATAPPILPTPEEVRADGRAGAVRTIADLQRSAFSSEVDLVVERAGKEATVRCDLATETAAVPVVPFHLEVAQADPEYAWAGVELAQVDSLPADLRPSYARPGDALVLRVAQGSPAAVAGLRPLDTIAADSLRPWVSELKPAEVHTASGKKSLTGFGRGVVREFWIPFVVTIEHDRLRTHVGLGPLDALFHYSSKKEYSPDADACIETSRWSLATTIVHKSVASPTGTRSTDEVAIFDTARIDYFSDWKDSK